MEPFLGFFHIWLADSASGRMCTYWFHCRWIDYTKSKTKHWEMCSPGYVLLLNTSCRYGVECQIGAATLRKGGGGYRLFSEEFPDLKWLTELLIVQYNHGRLCYVSQNIRAFQVTWQPQCHSMDEARETGDTWCHISENCLMLIIGQLSVNDRSSAEQ